MIFTLNPSYKELYAIKDAAHPSKRDVARLFEHIYRLEDAIDSGTEFIVNYADHHVLCDIPIDYEAGSHPDCELCKTVYAMSDARYARISSTFRSAK